MALTLITPKISYNNVLKLLELAIPYTTYTELLKHTSSGYYYELAQILEEFYYAGPINYRSIYTFLFNNVWKEQVEHDIFNKNTGKFTYTKPSFIADDDVKKFTYDNRTIKVPGFKKEKKTTPDRSSTKGVSKKKEHVEIIGLLL
jgi:hypothetical protein